MTGAHIHLLLTHLPVMAALFGLLILAYEVVEHVAGVSEAVIERHEEAALYGLLGTILLGLVSLGVLLRARGGLPRRAAGMTLLLALLVNGLLAWTANLGGQINHPEIRPGTTVVSSEQESGPAEAEHREDD